MSLAVGPESLHRVDVGACNWVYIFQGVINCEVIIARSGKTGITTPSICHYHGGNYEMVLLVLKVKFLFLKWNICQKINIRFFIQ